MNEDYTTALPDRAFQAERSPDTTDTRSSKGRRSFRVLGAHAVHRIGPDPFREDDQDLSGRPNLHLWTGPQLARMADAWCAQAGADLEPLIGLEQGRAFVQVTHTDGDAAEGSLVAQHRAGLDGGWNLPAMDRAVGTAGSADHKYRPSHTPELGWTLRDAVSVPTTFRPSVTRWPVRGAKHGRPVLPARARQTDPAGTESALVAYGDRGVKRTIVKRYEVLDAAGRVVELRHERTAVRSVPTSLIFVGHRSYARTPTVKGKRDEVRAVAAERAAVARDAAAQSAAGRALIAASVTDGPHVIDVGGTSVTFTARAGARVTYSWRRGDQSGRITARTPVAAAMRMATLGI